MLESRGIKTIFAKNGEEGIAQIKVSSDLVMIFCDVNMPVMTGIEMLAKIKKEDIKMANGSPIPPIVMLTTESSVTLSKKARENGALGWVVKPLRDNVLGSLLEKLAS